MKQTKKKTNVFEIIFFIGYIIEKCEEGSGFWEKVPGMVIGNSHTVKGLKDGKSYQFRVKAENIYGVSEPLTGNKIIAKNPFGK